MKHSDKYNKVGEYNIFNNFNAEYTDTFKNIFPKVNDPIDLSIGYTSSPSWRSFKAVTAKTGPGVTESDKRSKTISFSSTDLNTVLAMGYSKDTTSVGIYQVGYGEKRTSVVTGGSGNIRFIKNLALKDIVYKINVNAWNIETGETRLLSITDIVEMDDNELSKYVNKVWTSDNNNVFRPVGYYYDETTHKYERLLDTNTPKFTEIFTGSKFGGTMSYINTAGNPLYMLKRLSDNAAVSISKISTYGWVTSNNVWSGCNIYDYDYSSTTAQTGEGYMGLFPADFPTTINVDDFVDRYQYYTQKLTDNYYAVLGTTTRSGTSAKIYIAPTLKVIKDLLAGFCVFVTDLDDLSTATKADGSYYQSIDELIDDGHIWVGEMLNGLGTDKWLHNAVDIAKADNLTASTENIKFSPIPKPDPTVDEKSEYGGAPWLGKDSISISSGLSYMRMDSFQIGLFRQVINRLKSYDTSYRDYSNRAKVLGIEDSIADKNWKATFPTAADYVAYIYDKYGYGSDPINSVISITAFPFEIDSDKTSSINGIGNENLYISIPTGATGSGEVVFTNVEYYYTAQEDLYTFPVVKNDAFIKNIVSNYVITNPKGYTDFRTYSPYTRLELYIPMHGTIDLDPAVVMDKKLTVNIAITLADGSSVATVLINDSIYQTINGQVGYSIPLSAEASSTNNLALKTLSAQSQSQRLNAIGNVIHGLASTATSIATGNYGAAAGSTIDTLLTGQQNSVNSSSIKYQIEHATDGKVVVGQLSSLNAFMAHPNCQLIWHLPLMQGYDPDIYGKTVGYKCHKTTTLGSLTGYTECSNASLDSVSCTEAEKAMILEQLKSGVIV